MSSNNKQNGANQKRQHYEKIGDHVSIYQRGAIWWINYANPDGQQIRRRFCTRSKNQPKLIALQKEGELKLGEYSSAVKIPIIREAISAYDEHLLAEGRSKKTVSKDRHVLGRLQSLPVERGLR